METETEKELETKKTKKNSIAVVEKEGEVGPDAEKIKCPGDVGDA